MSRPARRQQLETGQEASPPPPGSERARHGRFFYDPARIPPRHAHRLAEIAPYYTDEVVLQLLVPVIDQTYDVSLRALDWAVVNWSKKHRVLCRVAPDDRADVINLFSVYKDTLRCWSRRMFDPFRRRERIYFLHPASGAPYSTTVGQLNFLRWAELAHVIDQARAHLPQIEQEMVSTLGESKRRRAVDRGAGQKRKRAELTPAPQSKCQVYIVSHQVEFD